MANQYTKAIELGLPKPIVSEETRKKLSLSTKRLLKIRYADPAYREKLSLSMKLAVKKYPQSYTSSNRGRTKQIDRYGLIFQGNWELLFYEWCIENFIKIEKAIIGFQYEWNGDRTYFPDFYLPEFNVYVEIKGYKTERDEAKWTYKLLIIRKEEINKIKRNYFNLLSKNDILFVSSNPIKLTKYLLIIDVY